MTTIFPVDLVSNASRVIRQKTRRIKGIQRENKHGDPIFLLHIFNVLCMSINCAKSEKILDSTSFSRELP